MARALLSERAMRDMRSKIVLGAVILCVVADGRAEPRAGQCPDGQLYCFDNKTMSPACVRADDLSNCGSCGHRCLHENPSTGEVGRCVAGKCVVECPQGRISCSGRCVDPKADPMNCGGCGIYAAGGACHDGQSQCPPATHLVRWTGAVPPGLPNRRMEGCCSKERPNLCFGEVEGAGCTNVKIDRANCGKCGKRCGPALACVNGTCAVPHCGGGLSRCGDHCADFKNDEANCGKCGHICPRGWQCQKGRCYR